MSLEQHHVPARWQSQTEHGEPQPVEGGVPLELLQVDLLELDASLGGRLVLDQHDLASDVFLAVPYTPASRLASAAEFLGQILLTLAAQLQRLLPLLPEGLGLPRLPHPHPPE